MPFVPASYILDKDCIRRRLWQHTYVWPTIAARSSVGAPTWLRAGVLVSLTLRLHDASDLRCGFFFTHIHRQQLSGPALSNGLALLTPTGLWRVVEKKAY